MGISVLATKRRPGLQRRGRFERRERRTWRSRTQLKIQPLGLHTFAHICLGDPSPGACLHRIQSVLETNPWGSLGPGITTHHTDGMLSTGHFVSFSCIPFMYLKILYLYSSYVVKIKYAVSGV